MLSFYVTLHARPAGVTDGPTVELSGHRVRTLRVAPEQLATAKMDRSFEAVIGELGKLTRMYCEPDGSFVWTSCQDEPRWQVDGNLYDRDGRMLFVDLKGTCPADCFEQLLAALGWPETKLMFQLTREAVFLGEDEFRRFAALAARPAGATPPDSGCAC